MYLLLDENLDPDLRKEFAEHRCESVVYAGLAGLKNGVLLAEAIQRGVDVLLTMDKSIPSQNYLDNLPIAVIVLRPRIPGINALKELLPRAKAALNNIQPNQVRVVSYLDEQV